MNDNSVKYLDIRTLPLIKSVDYRALLEKYVKRMYDYGDLMSRYDQVFTNEEKKELVRIYGEWAQEVKEGKRG